MVDLHSTVAGSEPLVFAQQIDPDVRRLVTATGLSRLVHINLDGTLIDHAPGVAIECGETGAKARRRPPSRFSTMSSVPWVSITMYASRIASCTNQDRISTTIIFLIIIYYSNILLYIKPSPILLLIYIFCFGTRSHTKDKLIPLEIYDLDIMPSNLSFRDIDDLDRLASVINGLSNTSRLSVLLAMDENRSMQEVAEALDITRGGLQRNIETLIEADLVYRPSQPNQTYALTPLGEYFIRWLQTNGDQLLTALSKLEGHEADISPQTESIREQLEDISEINADAAIDPSRAVSERELDRMVHTQKWERANEDVRKSLNID